MAKDSTGLYETWSDKQSQKVSVALWPVPGPWWGCKWLLHHAFGAYMNVRDRYLDSLGMRSKHFLQSSTILHLLGWAYLSSLACWALLQGVTRRPLNSMNLACVKTAPDLGCLL